MLDLVHLFLTIIGAQTQHTYPMMVTFKGVLAFMLLIMLVFLYTLEKKATR